MPTLVFPAAVRDEILVQHTYLRVLLKETVAVANAALEQDKPRLALAARALHKHVHAHLAFEDEELTPVVAVVDSWGPERVRHLHEAHVRQRRRLDELLSKC